MEKYKMRAMLISSLGLMLLVVGISYAFFNYTRTGNPNNFSVGRVGFVSRNEQTISLSNLFPIDPTETGIMNDSTKVGTYTIEIQGDTDYSEGLEYLVSIADANIYTSTGKTIPISVDITVNNLGTPEANYFTEREDKDTTIYKKLIGNTIIGEQMVLVGYIKPNTTLGTAEGVNGSITIKAYLDQNNIAISDTYDGTESDTNGTTNNWVNGRTVFTTSEWNSLQSNDISFKIKVEANEGIWVNGSLEEIMKTKAVMDNISSTYVSSNSGIDFGDISSDINGKGVYMRAGTENDEYPIMYYRGDIEDNNVLFADKCWKAVRTTDTGGVKLIYNGEKSSLLVLNKEYASPDTYATEHLGDIFTFDTTDSTWNFEVNDGQDHEIGFKVPTGDNYDMVVTGTTGISCGLSFYIWKNENQINGGGAGGGNAINFTHSYGSLSSSDELRLSISGASTTSSSCSVNIKINMQQGTTKLSKNDYSMMVKKDSGKFGCNNSGTATEITLNVGGADVNTFKFNTSENSPAYNGYMYGDVYTYNEGAVTSGAYFGSSFIWDGTNYKLVDPITTKSNTHHYTCNLTTADGTCTVLRYYYYYWGTAKYYINLTNGDGIEQAIKKMQTNTNDSNAKNIIDTWFETNLTNIVDNTMKDYRTYIEDTVWCNDRSFEGYDSGWIPNGGDLSKMLYYGATERSNVASDTSTTKNQPSLECAKKNDRFTVNNENGNGALTYPTALLTEDEIVLAGGVAFGTNEMFYLKNGTHWWSLSPYAFNLSSAYGFNLLSYGHLNNSNSVRSADGLRPAISIKPGQLITSGTGTVADPYVIG